MNAPLIFPVSARVIVGGPNNEGEYRVTIEGLSKQDTFRIIARLLADHARAALNA